jgi:hypothetical protein
VTRPGAGSRTIPRDADGLGRRADGGIRVTAGLTAAALAGHSPGPYPWLRHAWRRQTTGTAAPAVGLRTGLGDGACQRGSQGPRLDAH